MGAQQSGTTDPNQNCDPRNEQEKQLALAIYNDAGDKVREMLASGKVQVNKPCCPLQATWLDDTRWVSPLMYALMCNKGGYALQTLLNTPGIEINSPIGGMTPLDYAMAKCSDKLQKALLMQKEIKVNTTARPNQPPLLTATQNGDASVVELFTLKPDLALGLGQSVGYCLKKQKHEILQALVKAPGFRTYATAALLQSIATDVKSAMIILTSPHLDINVASNNIPNVPNGHTPLLGAVHLNNGRLVRSVLQHPKVDPNRGTKVTPLVHAIRHSHEEIIKMLLAHPQIDVNCGFDDTPLVAACAAGRADLVRLLLFREDLKPNLIVLHGENKMCTPLLFCTMKLATGDLTDEAERTGMEVLKALLEHPQIDPRLGIEGRSPYQLAKDLQLNGIVALFDSRLQHLPQEAPAPLPRPPAHLLLSPEERRLLAEQQAQRAAMGDIPKKPAAKKPATPVADPAPASGSEPTRRPAPVEVAPQPSAAPQPSPLSPAELGRDFAGAPPLASPNSATASGLPPTPTSNNTVHTPHVGPPTHAFVQSLTQPPQQPQAIPAAFAAPPVRLSVSGHTGPTDGLRPQPVPNTDGVTHIVH
eukprot:NODE_163_length_2031_cov_54.445378_g139_i0.p1 GENE.NODE_163_length_2031_cov_54.445378_g139_i0~~NODE_163_length_2031_cov_54.445378_g139_i0.p1  ORF type:complete len:589 (-),score=132.05 NODE_163_length_2031_cov_54.445378_g139_i0:106-1872(-)